MLSAYGHGQIVTGRLTGPGGAPIVGAAICHFLFNVTLLLLELAAFG